MPEMLITEGHIVIFENTEHYPGSVTFDGTLLTYTSEEYGTITWTPPESTLQQLLQMQQDREENFESSLGIVLHHMCNAAGKAKHSIDDLMEAALRIARMS